MPPDPRSSQIRIAASERAARALALDYGRTQSREAWPAPPIDAWESWLLREWQAREDSPLIVLSPWQECELWCEVIRSSGIEEAVLAESLAPLAQAAYSLLCDFSPQHLAAEKRSDWSGDARSFSRWLERFQSHCSERRWLPPAQLPLRAAELLRSEMSPRPAIELIGFDRVTPAQQAVLAAWGEHHLAAATERAAFIEHRTYTTPEAELAACTAWIEEQLAKGATRIALLLPSVRPERGAIERALRKRLAASSIPLAVGDATLPFEFTEGVALDSVPLVQAALLWLRWLHTPLGEEELLWLMQSGYLAASEQERLELAEADATLRRRGQQRTEWSITSFSAHFLPPQSSMRERIQRATELLPATSLTPIEWAARVPHLLKAMGFPGWRPLTSGEMQAQERWMRLLDESAALGAITGSLSFSRYLELLRRRAAAVLFAQQSQAAAVQIMEPVTAAGQHFDATWFLGATEASWPAVGNPNPLLPLALQRLHRMPNASAVSNWELAAAVTKRIAASTQSIVFSYPLIHQDGEQRASSLIVPIAGDAVAQPEASSAATATMLEKIAQSTWLPYSRVEIAGGASVLTDQSNCAFRAFAKHRLGARVLEPAQLGLTAAERGQLLHKVLEQLWSPGNGPWPDGSINLLASDAELEEAAAHAVDEVFSSRRAIHPNHNWERSYIELERKRLTSLVVDWLCFERKRPPFTVEATEQACNAVTVGTLKMNLRNDRIDKLEDGSLLILDYKTGKVSAKAWETPRPEDVQLPLYATFAAIEPVGGLVFACIKAGEKNQTFKGCVRDSRQIMSGLTAQNDLVKRPLTGEMLQQWRSELLALANSFARGEAMVNPRNYPETCERCAVKPFCRIAEERAILCKEEPDDDEASS